jgi:GT2 family glycosyltransferase
MNLVIIPVACGPAMTKAAIDSALAQDIGEVRALVIDNASTDGTGPWLRTLDSERITVLQHLRPISLNRIWNKALDLAFRSLHLDHALVINNDVTLRTDTYRLLRDTGLPFVTGVGVDSLDQALAAQPAPANRSPHPSFSCFLLRKEVWETVGPFDEQFWAWASDGDYHLRMDAAGIDAWSIDLPFHHIGSATLKNVPHEEHLRLCRLSDEDRAKFHAKWGCAIGSDEYYARFHSKRDNKYSTTGRL